MDDAQREALLDAVKWVRRRIRNFFCILMGGHEYYGTIERSQGFIIRYRQQCIRCLNPTHGWDLST